MPVSFNLGNYLASVNDEAAGTAGRVNNEAAGTAGIFSSSNFNMASASPSSTCGNNTNCMA